LETLMNRRELLVWMGGTSLIATSFAQAPSYPNAPLRIIAPYAAGGGLDSVARIVAQALAEQLGQSVVVDNRPGAGGTIGANAVAKAAPDGYTLLMAGNPEVTIATALGTKLPYTSATDFAPIVLVSQSPNVLVAHPSLGANTLARVLEMGRRKTMQLSIASPGNASPQHITIEALKSVTSIDILHVPYKGAGPATIAVLSGEVKLALVGAPPVLPHIKAGKLLALAVTQQVRSPLLPDVPTVTESTGLLKGDDFLTWYGLLLPARTPPTILQLLEKTVNSILERADIKDKFAALGTDLQGTPSAKFAERIRQETTRYTELIKRHNISPDS
jgi:tripartite-type tricarboxylate transporter receptor subunit TctC